MNSNAILIVDDDADDREILKEAFQSHLATPEYLMFENGDELLEYLHQNEANLPQLILLDLNMPGKDGRQALKEIKVHESLLTVPIVVLTTSSSTEDRRICYKMGANCFVTKPNTFDNLVQLTRSISYLWMPQND